jgi:3-methyladenine DNA glycosylase AlkD
VIRTLRRTVNRRIGDSSESAGVATQSPNERGAMCSEFSNMKQTTNPHALARELQSRLARLPSAHTEAIRAVRRELSLAISDAPSQFVMELALHLLSEQNDQLRFVAYELVSHHKPTFTSLCTDDLVRLGEGLDSWSSVDCFGMYLSGPTWAADRISDDVIISWTGSEDRWWRRASLVSTVPLARRANARDVYRVIEICTLLTPDRDDMVVKALSWALRELAKKDHLQAVSFLGEHRHALAARVIREVENKIRTGLKTPRRSANVSSQG